MSASPGASTDRDHIPRLRLAIAGPVLHELWARFSKASRAGSALRVVTDPMREGSLRARPGVVAFHALDSSYFEGFWPKAY